MNLRIVCCDTCDGAGRYECGPYVIDRNDGSVHGHEYDCHVCEGGGELQVEDTFGRHSIKLGAGDMVVYPATSLHQVSPITRGVRTSCFFWVQSLIRDDTQRALLHDMDNAIQRLNQTNADEVARRTLIGCYHNLVRQWSET